MDTLTHLRECADIPIWRRIVYLIQYSPRKLCTFFNILMKLYDHTHVQSTLHSPRKLCTFLNIHLSFWLADRTRLFVQYTISLSSLRKLIWRHWSYKMPVRYILSSVWVRLSIFSPLAIIQYVGLYVFSLPISLVMIERIYILCLIIIIKSEVWTITHFVGLGHETMVSAVCLYIFLLYTYWAHTCIIDTTLSEETLRFLKLVPNIEMGVLASSLVWWMSSEIAIGWHQGEYLVKYAHVVYAFCCCSYIVNNTWIHVAYLPSFIEVASLALVHWFR